MTLGERLFHALASLRLAVATMVALATACIAATFYESAHGTAAAQREFYGTWWFSLVLTVLAINILFSMLRRHPWKTHHAGFVLAHVGILALLAGSLVSLHVGLDSSMALYEGETSDRVTLPDQALHVALPGHVAHGTFPLDFEARSQGAGHERRFRIPGSDDVLVVEESRPHVGTVETFAEAQAGGPALRLSLEGPFARQEGWLAADDGERSHADFGPVAVDFHRAPTEAAVREVLSHVTGQSRISFVIAPDGSLRYGLVLKDAPGTSGRVEVGAPLETPWMGMKVTVERFFPRAEARHEVVPEALPEKEDRRVPAVKVRLEGRSGKSASEWLPWGESRRLYFDGGQATVAYRSSDAAVPFRVTLLKFRSAKYPGSSLPATYESWVRVEDPERGSSEHHISMNHPLHYRGYIFFQASYVEGQPMMSIFSVTRAPGLPLVYVGTAFLSLGIVWMFYLKPYLAGRQGEKALAAWRGLRTEALS